MRLQRNIALSISGTAGCADKGTCFVYVAESSDDVSEDPLVFVCAKRDGEAR